MNHQDPKPAVKIQGLQCKIDAKIAKRLEIVGQKTPDIIRKLQWVDSAITDEVLGILDMVNEDVLNIMFYDEEDNLEVMND